MLRLLPVVGLLTLPLGAADPAVVFPAEDVRFYEQQVKPLLAKNCNKCHGATEKIKGGLRLTTRANILTGGDSGPAVDLKNPDKSLLLLAVTNQRPDGEVMPPSGQLPEADVAILKKWVTAKIPVSTADLGVSAPAHAEEKPNIEAGKNYWAYRPVTLPAVPKTSPHPIDAFLDAKRAEKNLVPRVPADKVTLVRRAYYDLLGLPPTPEQVDAFVNDPSPEAFAKLIDTLLASPHYGEKWGRHWLDVVRYAETNGYERDGPKPNAWRYRDYVIRSFNADKPYTRFLTEQLAGDELPEWHADNIIATGFYRLGVWDDEPADGQQALYDGYDDIVSVIGQGMLGSTFNCARCHDHKKDPILQADYYKLVAFVRDIRPFSDTRNTFASTNSTDISPPERRKLYEAELTARNDQIDALTQQMTAVENEVIKKMPAEDQRAAEGLDRPQVVAKLAEFATDVQKKQYNGLKKQRAELQNKPLPMQDFALSINKCDPTPPPVYVLARGNPHAPKEKELCPPGFPAVLGGGEATATRRAKTSGRRTELAKWLTDPANPLTARVMVNRVWQHHFGKGIVPTPNDFGKLGEPPTHPELLDWLAQDFVTHGTTLKRLHKLMMTSAAYQRASSADPKNLAADPANATYWRFNPRRLAAEEVRDSILSVSGKLRLEQFGPSVYPKIPADVLAGQSVPGQGWLKAKGGGFDPANPDRGNRRSVYVHVKRSLQVPILVNHDQADTDSSCPVRYTTTVPTQALGLLNGEFSHEQAAALAERVRLEHPGDVTKQVARIIRLTTARLPNEGEVAKDVAFLTSLKSKHQLSEPLALARYALLALNTNEFVYLD